MPALFTLPQVVPLSSLGAILPGSKLYFFLTGTTTPQDVYQDIDLATPHSQPVVADGSGVFDPIYLDPGASDYRARLTDSNDVQLWQIDDIPSNQQVVQTLDVVAADPEIVLENTAAVAGQKKARLKVGADYVALAFLNDAESAATDILRAERLQNTVTSFRLIGQRAFLGERVTKDNETSRTSTTTLADDPELLLSLQGLSTYILEGVLYFRGGGSPGAGGIKLCYSYTGTLLGPTPQAEVTSHVDGTGAVEMSAFTTIAPLTYATIAGGGSAVNNVRLSIPLKTLTSGTLSIQWAQNSSSGTASIMEDFSWLRAHRMNS